jgi:hypothetical protein
LNLQVMLLQPSEFQPFCPLNLASTLCSVNTSIALTNFFAPNLMPF